MRCCAWQSAALLIAGQHRVAASASRRRLSFTFGRTDGRQFPEQIIVGIGTLHFVLDKGQQDDWFASPMIAALAATSAVALLIHELRTAVAIIDLRVA